MLTNEDKKEQLLQEIRQMKNGSYEQMFLITYYGLGSYFRSLLTFGARSDVTRDNLNVIKEMFAILRTERKMLNYILDNLDVFNIQAATASIEMLDAINDKTVEYYYSVVDEIEDACDMREERRGIRPKKDFPTLTQTSSYENEIIALAENRASIKSFLGFEEEFWVYIKGHEHSVEVSPENAEEIAYVNYLVDKDGNVSGIKLLVPEVVDLSTALLAIKLYRRAYEIYKMVGKKYDSQPTYDYVELQDKFKNHYLAKKAFNTFNKKM